MRKKNTQAFISLIIQQIYKYKQKKIKQEKNQHAVHVYSYLHLTCREFLTSDNSLIDKLVKWGRK